MREPFVAAQVMIRGSLAELETLPFWDHVMPGRRMQWIEDIERQLAELKEHTRAAIDHPPVLHLINEDDEDGDEDDKA